MVDATIKVQTLAVEGVEHNFMTLRAHRIHSIDYNGWRKAEAELTDAARADTP
jgi:hypothetical protein